MSTCSKCVHLKRDERPDYADHGYCRRYPPQLVAWHNGSDNYIEQHWPWMSPTDWCAEYTAGKQRP